MSKVETVTMEYEHCGECPNGDWIGNSYLCCKIEEGEPIIKDLWGEIPKWCPLPDKEV